MYHTTTTTTTTPSQLTSNLIHPSSSVPPLPLPSFYKVPGMHLFGLCNYP
jgi:hypothetical protein